MSDELTFAPEVFERLKETRRIAKLAKKPSEARRATPEEIALATQLLEEGMCGRTSWRTGLPCRQRALQGMEVCKIHGGSLKQLRIKAQRQITSQLDPIVRNMVKTATQTENLVAATKAGADLLDRAGVGAKVQAAVRASKRQLPDTSQQIQVNIGFLGNNS